ncbi:MAG: AAA family ATPase [Deferribacteraceae bacterium]|jgi:AAA15 family ATPase/GTPase|nr:AAA family ATPase [Deferribacteraceae bacterium]
MLINFSFENWSSFRDRTDFSLIVAKERQHGDRVPGIDKYKIKVLPITAIYGGNASGKTNFFGAFYFAKQFIVKGLPPDASIRVDPYRKVLVISAEGKTEREYFDMRRKQC